MKLAAVGQAAQNKQFESIRNRIFKRSGIVAMSEPLRPRLRVVESFPINGASGDVQLRSAIPRALPARSVIPGVAAVLASLMDGNRTLGEIRQEFATRFGQTVDLADLEQLRHGTGRAMLSRQPAVSRPLEAGDRSVFERPGLPAPPMPAGLTRANPEALLKQLDRLFVPPAGPGLPGEPGSAVGVQQPPVGGSRLVGVLSPHIDLHRGGNGGCLGLQAAGRGERRGYVCDLFGTAHSWTRIVSVSASISRRRWAW